MRKHVIALQSSFLWTEVKNCGLQKYAGSFAIFPECPFRLYPGRWGCRFTVRVLSQMPSVPMPDDELVPPIAISVWFLIRP